LQEPQPVDIKQIVAALTSDYPELSADHLHQYLNEILRWNPRVGIVSRHDTTAIVARLVRQSLHLLELVRPRTEAVCGKELHVVDVGSGGGFPGLVWAMVEPDWRFLLVERRHKKAAFLERMVKVLGIEDVEVYAGSAQEAQTIGRFSERFDAATTMAVGRPVKTASLVEGFLRSGRIFATTVPRDEAEPRGNVGTRMRLLETSSDDDSLYALYMKQ
jgi:16S rRNA (guanine(527)-N(7))-methyltransferase RsmG